MIQCALNLQLELLIRSQNEISTGAVLSMFCDTILNKIIIFNLWYYFYVQKHNPCIQECVSVFICSPYPPTSEQKCEFSTLKEIEQGNKGNNIKAVSEYKKDTIIRNSQSVSIGGYLAK